MIRSLLVALALLTTLVAGAQETPNIVVTGFPLYAKAITPHDSNVLTNHAGNPQDQFVFVGGAGNVACVPSGNTNAQIIIFSLAAGAMVPVRCRLVRATSTTATALTGLW